MTFGAGAVGITASKKFCMIAGRPRAVIYNFPTDHFANFGRLICPNLPDRKTWADFTRLATGFLLLPTSRSLPVSLGALRACLLVCRPGQCADTQSRKIGAGCPMPYPVRPKFCPHKVSPSDAKGLTIDTEIHRKTFPKEVN